MSLAGIEGGSCFAERKKSAREAIPNRRNEKRMVWGLQSAKGDPKIKKI